MHLLILIQVVEIIIQMLAGALIGGGIAIKVYWEKIKMKFLK